MFLQITDKNAFKRLKKHHKHIYVCASGISTLKSGDNCVIKTQESPNRFIGINFADENGYLSSY